MFLHPSLIVQVLPLAGIVGAIVGLAWVLHVSRDDPEAGDRTWRYRDLTDLQLRPRRRLARARTLIRLELVIAVAAAAVAGFLYVAAPGTIEPMFFERSLFEQLLLWVPIGGVIVGFVWMVHLSRADPEAGDRTWRYRDLSDLERRRRRLARAHIMIRLELVIAVAAAVVAGFLYVAAPRGYEPMFLRPSLFEQLLPFGAIVGTIFGFVWMVRLSRADPEAGDRTWRYRDF
jgi:hypothetical protein